MESTLSILFLLLISAVASENENCTQGRYLEQRSKKCRLCSDICDEGRGTAEKCEQYASECKTTTPLPDSSAVSSPSDILFSTEAEDQTGEEKQPQRMPLEIIVFASISCFVVLFVFSAVILNVFRRRWLRGKPSLVQAVHPVEEGKGQIIPSSSAPPRIVASNRYLMTSSSFLFPVDFRGHPAPAAVGKEAMPSGVEYDNYVNEATVNRQNTVVYKSTFEGQRF